MLQKKYIALKDSLYNINKAKVITELNAKYEGEKKAGEINWLIKENKLKNNSKNEKRTTYIFYGFNVLHKDSVSCNHRS